MAKNPFGASLSKNFSSTSKGNTGYDNERENIDPHIKTKILSGKHIISKKATFENLDIGFSIGSIVFQGVNDLTENANFTWDNTNNVLKISNSIEDSIGISLNNPIIATPPEAQNSPIFELSGNIWNSAQGTKVMSGGMQVQHDLNNANPPISKLSFLVGSNNDDPTEQMFVTSLGQFNIIGGADFAGTSLSESNSLVLRNKAAATSSVPQNSNKIVLEGRAWNSAQGNINNQGYIQLLNSVNNANPFTERMGFFMQEGVRNGDFTERLSIDNTGNVGIGTIGPTEKLDVDGTIKHAGHIENINTTAKTANYTVLSSDDNILCNTNSGAFTITLPASPENGRIYTIILETAGNNLTINGNGKNINGSSTNIINSQYDTIQIIYNGTQWNIK